MSPFGHLVDRLQKILSRAGIASRRASEQLMLDGRVTVNGVTVRELGTKADPARDEIRVDGRRIKLPERHRYILLNKPRGYVTTRSDPQRRPTVMDLLTEVHEYIYPVGRLDYDSEGLLLLTNDGDLAARLTHPRHGVLRVYEARVLGIPDDRDLERLAYGVDVDGRKTQPATIRALDAGHHDSKRAGSSPSLVGHPRARSPGSPKRSGGGRGRTRRGAPEATTVLRIAVREGRNRQVRKMCDAIGHPVEHLKRVAIGPIRGDTLKPGQWRDLSRDEVTKLKGSGG